MKRSKFTEEQIGHAPRQVEGGTPVADVCLNSEKPRGDRHRR